MSDYLLIAHGWSDSSSGFKEVADFLVKKQIYDRDKIRFIDYKSLDDQAKIEDFADKLDDLFKLHYLDQGIERIDVLCHSTGSLIIRGWLALRRTRHLRRYPNDKPDLPVEHLFMFAPANFGSDLALFGQSGLHRLRTTFNIGLGDGVDTDVFEVGEQVLQALEPASPLQWQLSNLDLHNEVQENTYFGINDQSGQICFPFIFAGGKFEQNFFKIFDQGIGKKLVRKAIKRTLPNVVKPGTDGTVRICGTSLNTRKCVIRLFSNNKLRFDWIKENKFENIPFAVFTQYNHGAVVKEALTDKVKDSQVLELFKEAKKVSNLEEYQNLAEKFTNITKHNYEQERQQNSEFQDEFQQFFFKIYDDTNVEITDVFIDFYVRDKNGEIDETLTEECDQRFDNKSSWYPHSVAPSYRCLLLNYTELHNFCRKLDTDSAVLMMSIEAKGHSEEIFFSQYELGIYGKAVKDSPINNNVTFGDIRYDFLSPNTTTLVEIILDRQQSKRLVKIV